MEWYEIINGASFRRWLEELTRTTHIRQGVALDPFQTSMRVFRKVPQWLEGIESTGSDPAASSDPPQSTADLGKAGLAMRTSSGGAALTALGEATLAKWREFGLMDDDSAQEVARCLCVVWAGVEQASEKYLDMFAFWKEIRALYDVDDLFANPAGLYLPSYLNQELSGFNPWQVIAAAGARVTVETGSGWQQIVASIPELDDAVDVLKKRVADFSTRATGRINFCTAMELLRLPAPSALAWLDNWDDEDEEAAAYCRDVLLAIRPTAALSEKQREVLELLKRRQNVVLYGPPGTGKTHAALAIADQWRIDNGDESVMRLTFHPSYSYEDFVEGFRPTPDDPGRFELAPGALLEACRRANRIASRDPQRGVLLMIDEINRADVGKVFGELMTFMEPDKRGVSFVLAQSSGNSMSLPKNLYFLGTMNTADRSISLMDVAMRRRFAFVEFPPESEFYSSQDALLQAVETVDLGRLLKGINRRLDSIGIEPDRAVGHAVFALRKAESEPLDRLREILKYDVYPLVVEYCYANRESVRTVLPGLVDESGIEERIGSLSDEDLIEALNEIAGD